MVQPLPEQLNRRLSPIHLPGWHVQVVHKRNLCCGIWGVGQYSTINDSARLQHEIKGNTCPFKSVCLSVCLLLTVFHPSGGPKTPFLLLSNLERMMFWVWFALVCAEKLIRTGLYTSLGRRRRMKSCRGERERAVRNC